MKQETDLVYLGRRATEERRAAGSSGNSVVRDLHLELASAYEFRVHLLRKEAAIQAARARAGIELSAAEHARLQASTPAQQPDQVIPNHVSAIVGRSG